MNPLQEFGFEKSVYERPNQTWICGHAREGKCCLAGPDAHGHCTAKTECRPLRKGDHWHCTRPAFLGGPCTEGPLPDGSCCRVVPKCSPIRSLRSWRGLTVAVMVAATLAVLFITFGSSDGNRVISPGELSFSHSSVNRRDCSRCHGPLQGRPAAWLTASASSVAAQNNSQLCLNCHPRGETPLQPHSLSAADLRTRTEAILKRDGRGSPPLGLTLASFIANPGGSGETNIACATCHKEHQGNEADLKKMTNRQCQSCHVTQFASLEHGHPQFTDYPFDRPRPIHFDHQSHFGTNGHFKEDPANAQKEWKCQDCHQTDLRGDTMVVKPFETICASCHESKIKTSPAIAFILLPRMDDSALKDDYAIGNWPEDADAKKVNPFLGLLLSADPPMRQALNQLEGTDLSNLPKTNAAKLKAAQTVAWGIKSLIFDLEARGQNELIERIGRSSGQQLTDHEKEGLVAFINSDTVRNTFANAFTNLQSEVLAYRNHGKFATTVLVSSPPDVAKPDTVKPAQPDVWVKQGGWYSPDALLNLSYHPRGHADRFLSSWLNLTVNADHNADPASSRAVFKELSVASGPGLCTKCHGIDETPARKVNWMASHPDPFEHGFNNFSHLTHLSLLGPNGCLSCHPMNGTDSAGKPAVASAAETDPHAASSFHSNFETIDKARCIVCHRSNQVRDDCLLCHNYHIGRFEPLVARANNVPPPPPNGKM